MNWPKRFYLLDILRGLASIGVVIFHWQHFAFTGIQLPENFDRKTQPFYNILKLFYENGNAGVPLFFLLSGFIFFWLYSKKIKTRIVTERKFWIARFSRLYPLHFATLIIVLILQIVFWNVRNEYFVYQFNDIHHFLLNLSLTNHWGAQKGFSFNGPIWSVSIEILLYFIFFTFAKKNILNPFVSVFIVFTSFILMRLAYQPVFLGTTLFFLGGTVFYLIEKQNKNRIINLSIFLIALISWVIVLINHYYLPINEHVTNFGLIGKIANSIFRDFILFPSTLYSLIIFELMLSNKNTGITFLKKISWIGDISYSIYLLHFPLQMIFGLLAYYQIINSNFHEQKIYFLFFFILLIPFSYLAFNKYEKPIQTHIRKILTKKHNNV